MPLLPSPIPHPLSYFDAPDWMRTALEWVVGIDWPDGDEAALRELADDWYAASRQMGPLLDEADDAVLAAVAAMGGPDGRVAAAILALWSQVGSGHDAAGQEAVLAMVVDLLDDFGTQVDAGANQIEGVKIEFYVELGLLLIELIALAAAAAVTLGASMAGAAPAMYATRFAIQQALRRAAKELLERAAKKGLKDKLKDRIEDAVKDKIKSKVVRQLGGEAIEEGLQEGATSLGTQLYQVSEGNRSGLDGADLALDTGLGALGGGISGVTSLGKTHAQGTLGRFGEHALRGASGEILAEVSVNLVTGQDISAQALGMAATSATTGSVTGDTRALVDGRLHGAELKLSGAMEGGGDPGAFPPGDGPPSVTAVGDGTALPGPLSALGDGTDPAASGSAGPLGAGADAPASTSAGPLGTTPDALVSTSAGPLGDGAPLATAAASVDTAGPLGLAAFGGPDGGPATVSADASIAAPDATAVSAGTAVTDAPTDPGGLPFDDRHHGSPSAQQWPADFTPFDPHAAPPSDFTPFDPAAEPSAALGSATAGAVLDRPDTTVAPHLTAPAIDDGTAHPAPASGGVQPPSTGASAGFPHGAQASGGAVPHALPPTPTRPATTPTPDFGDDRATWLPYSPANSAAHPAAPTAHPPHDDPDREDGVAAFVAVGPGRGAQVSDRIPPDWSPATPASALFRPRVTDDPDERDRYQRYTEFDRINHMRDLFDPLSAKLQGRYRSRADDCSAQLQRGYITAAEQQHYQHGLSLAQARLTDLRCGPIEDPLRSELSAADYQEFQELRYGTREHAMFDLTDGAVNDLDYRSLATGQRWPHPVEASRVYGKPGGYRMPLSLHQQDVELAVERDEDGRPRRFSDLFGRWPRLANDGGAKADPGRAINCTDVVLSVIDTWLHGRPRVAAPRVTDAFTPHLNPLGGEPGGALRIEQAVGGRFGSLLADQRGSTDTESWIARREAIRTLENALRQQGHGAVAVLVYEHPSGASHAITVHNQHGEVLYVDAQDTEDPVKRRFSPAPLRMDALLLGSDGYPVDLGLPWGNWSAPDDAPAEPGVSEVEATGRQRPSDVYATPEQVAAWDELAGGRLDELVAELKARDDLTVDQKLHHLREELFREVAPAPSHVGGDLDTKNLRCYEWQSGELFVHATALMLDSAATIEIAYEPDQFFTQYRDDPSDPYLAHAGPMPEGMTRDLADKAVLWRSLSGRSTVDVDPAELASDAIDMQVRPLQGALDMRERLIGEFGVAPDRIRLCHDDQPRDVHYTTSKFRRAHLVALPHVRESGTAARAAMVAAMRGEGERGERRDARARALAEQVIARHEPDGQPASYALLWVRRTRVPMGAFMDTKPELLRQTVALLREADPGRRILLIGDDLFDGRPELRAAYEAEGALDGVDTETLRRFWAADRHGGHALGQGEQALFLHHLDSRRDVVQIGMESGALETAIALGVPTVYFQGREHVGDKGVRWQLYWDTWEYGQRQAVLGEDGQPQAFDSGRPRTEFTPHTGPLRAPLATIHRVEFGPDLPDPADRLTPPVAVYHPATVSAVSDRVVRLAAGEVDLWPHRLGRDWSLLDSAWTPWTPAQWADSRYCADQAERWLRTVPGDIEAAARKWDAIQHALAGVLRPEAAAAYREGGHHTDAPASTGTAARLAAAYETAAADRPQAVAAHVKQLLTETEPRRQAGQELRLLGLDAQEVGSLRTAIERAVTARDTIRRMEAGRTAPADGLPNPPDDVRARETPSGYAEEVRMTLESAASGRADGGNIADGAVDSLLVTAPTLSAGADQPAPIAAYTSARLGGPVTVAEITGSTGAKGLSGAPVMLANDADGNPVGVVKIFPDAEEFARELSALHRLRSGEFRRFHTAEPLGIAVTQQRQGVVVSALAAGRPLDDLLGEVGTSSGASWTDSFVDLERSVAGVGAALADLHTTAEGSGGAVARAFVERHVAVIRKWTGQVVDTLRALPGMTVDLDVLTSRIDEVITAADGVRGRAALAHGDAHPGNFFWHPQQGVTIIDLPMLHHSMDETGGPIGAAERDLAYFDVKLQDFGVDLGLKPEELAHLRRTFWNAYRDTGGPEPDPALMRLFGVRGAVHVLKEVPYRVPHDAPRRNELLQAMLESKLGPLLEVLKWNR
ncbi:toxin glutamine deamidase domain-containing protein [Catellatospora sp. NPDC049609]|uniref:toxin glutamine deamidase domain-containing protein n=1 Tax=Catellatospora sp. NPDC049609 TaxID=3155505 RepID=UPI00343E0709